MLERARGAVAGSGVMAEAMIQAMLSRTLVSPAQIAAVDLGL